MKNCFATRSHYGLGDPSDQGANMSDNDHKYFTFFRISILKITENDLSTQNRNLQQAFVTVSFHQYFLQFRYMYLQENLDHRQISYFVLYGF